MHHAEACATVLVITRGAGALRLTLPDYWTPCPINWNGNDAGKALSGGCWLLTPACPRESVNRRRRQG